MCGWGVLGRLMSHRTRSDGRRHDAPNRKEQRHDVDHLLWAKAGVVSKRDWEGGVAGEA